MLGGGLGRIFIARNLSIGVLALRWEDNKAARWTDLNIQWYIRGGYIENIQGQMETEGVDLKSMGGLIIRKR